MPAASHDARIDVLGCNVGVDDTDDDSRDDDEREGCFGVFGLKGAESWCSCILTCEMTLVSECAFLIADHAYTKIAVGNNSWNREEYEL